LGGLITVSAFSSTTQFHLPDFMKFLSWNCRGLSRPSAIRSLRVLIRNFSPDVIFLSETKIAPPHATDILHRLGFYLISQVASSGSRGGLLLAWRPGIALECFASNENHISAWCYSDPPNTPWILSCVYGPPDRRDRIAFWESFSSVGKNFVGSWLCLGDFNSVLDQTEKFGGRPVVSSSNCPFRNFIDIFGMVDLGFTGNQYTWSNNRQGNCIIKERLDRGLASSSWVHLFPEYSLLHIPAFSSDHHPILLNTSGSPLFLPRPFKFEEFWTKDPTCGQVIDAAWQVAVSGNPAFCLVKKLKHTKAALRRWNSLYFGNIQNRIKSTLISIDKVQCGPASLNSSVLESQLKLELEDLLVKEEIYWRNKSRETWLTCNDLNTKYFHTSTLIKRRSNAVDFLKSDSGVWLSDRPAIGGQFVTHFSNLFSTSIKFGFVFLLK
jgi:exonuclease III